MNPMNPRFLALAALESLYRRDFGYGSKSGTAPNDGLTRRIPIRALALLASALMRSFARNIGLMGVDSNSPTYRYTTVGMI